MKIITIYFTAVLLLLSVVIHAQTTVTDYDGNTYGTVTIGTQTWLSENIKSLHYFDGVPIPNVVAYNNDENNVITYGRLYTWKATVRDSIAAQVQGVCPCGWHVASNSEWSTLEQYLGGQSVAGGKLKDTTEGTWNEPNVGATNSSGFTALPGGEFDPIYGNNFQYLHQAAVFWTSSNYNNTLAIERYMMDTSNACLPYNWYKTMKYSVRCIKNIDHTSIKDFNSAIEKCKVFPNPATNKLSIIINQWTEPMLVEIADVQGKIVLQSKIDSPSKTIDIDNLKHGNYLVTIKGKTENWTFKVLKL